jgi:alkylation response protein AidB-like acyl-CoA dehydrogenase
VQQTGWELCLELMGDEALLYDGYEMRTPQRDELDRPRELNVPRQFLRSRANSIEGGTTEVMHNILARRVLGLPTAQEPSKGTPFAEIPRG